MPNQIVVGGTSSTVTDWHGVEAPADLDGVDLSEGCPSCGYANAQDTFVEVPDGYFTCLRCFSTWAGEPGDADLVTYLEWAEDMTPEELLPDRDEAEAEQDGEDA